MNVIFMGTPDFALKSLQAIYTAGYNILAVVTNPDKPKGRGMKMIASPVKEFAIEKNIKVYQPEKIKIEYQKIIDSNPDIIVTCAYGQIIPKELLDFPRYGCINVHASLLPKLRGGAPIHKAIIDGYSETGITIMYMDVAMDSGDIISQEKTIIKEEDNLERLHDRLSLMGKYLLLKTLPSIFEGTNERIPQDINEVTYAYNIKREEEHIDFNKSAIEVFNLIRGLSPAPSAFTILDGEELKVYSSRIGIKKEYEDCGKIVNIYKDGIGVSTKTGEIILTEVKPFGKKRMLVRDYLNGVNKDELIGKILK